MSPAEIAEVQAWARREWLAACAAFVACCSAAGVSLDAMTVARMDCEVRRIAADHEHVGLSDLQVLRLAHARVTPANGARAARTVKVVLERMRKGGTA